MGPFPVTWEVIGRPGMDEGGWWAEVVGIRAA